MNKRQGYSGGSLILAFLGGAVAGAAAALLTTPKSGRETRELLTDAAQRNAERTKHLPEAVKVASTAAREAFSEVMHEAK